MSGGIIMGALDASLSVAAVESIAVFGAGFKGEEAAGDGASDFAVRRFLTGDEAGDCIIGKASAPPILPNMLEKKSSCVPPFPFELGVTAAALDSEDVAVAKPDESEAESPDRAWRAGVSEAAADSSGHRF